MSDSSSWSKLLIGALIGAIASGAGTYLNMKNDREIANYQVKQSQESLDKQNQLLIDQRKIEVQAEYIYKLRESFNELDLLREQFYMNKYPLVVSRIIYKNNPNWSEAKEYHDKVHSVNLAIENDLIGKINIKKATFKSLLEVSRTHFSDPQIIILIDNVIFDLSNYYGSFNEDEIGKYFYSSVKSTGNQNEAYYMAYDKFDRQTYIRYNLPISFRTLVESMELEYTSKRTAISQSMSQNTLSITNKQP